MLDVPVQDAAVDDLQRRQAVGDRAYHVRHTGIRVRQVALENQRDFGFHPRLDHPRRSDGRAVADQHVGKQHAVVGLIDAELLLHRARGQADLASDQAAAGRKGRPGVDVLDCIGCFGIGWSDRIAHRRDRLALLLRCPQGRRHLFQVCRHRCLPRKFKRKDGVAAHQ